MHVRPIDIGFNELDDVNSLVTAIKDAHELLSILHFRFLAIDMNSECMRKQKMTWSNLMYAPLTHNE